MCENVYRKILIDLADTLSLPPVNYLDCHEGKYSSRYKTVVLKPYICKLHKIA